MKKLIILFTLLLLVLTACGGENSEASNANTAALDTGAKNTGDSSSSGEGNEDWQPSEINALLIGTFMLEESEDTITAEQAVDLLPLWKLAQNLTGSGTAADAEIQAVADQIQSVMTDAQVTYITEGEFTTQDMLALLDGMGISLVSGDAESGSSGLPGSGLGGGAGRSGVPGDGELTEEQQATMEARREAGGGGSSFLDNPAVFDALIDILEAKIN